MRQIIVHTFHLACILLLFPVACNGGQMEDKTVRYEKLSDVPETVWREIAGKKIYFGHQSVGYNILNGVRQVLQQNPQIPLTIEETYDPDNFKSGTIAQSQIGYNGNPKSKLDMFAYFTKAAGSDRADIMFFKFCYLDINKNTDVEAVFNDYKEKYAQLERQYPETTFIHLTVPLTTIQTGVKAMIKKVVGRPLGGVDDNIKRCEFNELLRATYAGKKPLLDIAALESTFPDGQRASFEANGKTYYHLVPEYTSDGSHLNAKASRMVAEKLLLTIAGSV